jgi:hypothetical protein
VAPRLMPASLALAADFDVASTSPGIFPGLSQLRGPAHVDPIMRCLGNPTASPLRHIPVAHRDL